MDPRSKYLPLFPDDNRVDHACYKWTRPTAPRTQADVSRKRHQNDLCDHGMVFVWDIASLLLKKI